jgi:hypothetical protein
MNIFLDNRLRGLRELERVELMALAGCTEWTTRSPRASQPLKIKQYKKKIIYSSRQYS